MSKLLPVTWEVPGLPTSPWTPLLPRPTLAVLIAVSPTVALKGTSEDLMFAFGRIAHVDCLPLTCSLHVLTREGRGHCHERADAAASSVIKCCLNTRVTKAQFSHQSRWLRLGLLSASAEITSTYPVARVLQPDFQQTLLPVHHVFSLILVCMWIPKPHLSLRLNNHTPCMPTPSTRWFW